MLKRKTYRFFFLIVGIFLGSAFMQNSLIAENLVKIKNLDGQWKFTIGDDPLWASPNYNDTDWDYIEVPGSWEKNGFKNYDGYAWYRKTFRLSMPIPGNYVFLNAGYIDDVDEVYINGKLIGSSGIFPPLVRTAYQIERKYPVPVELLNTNGDNLIAIRVFDDYLDGGITRGETGIYTDKDNDLLLLNLSGYWNFETINGVTPTSDQVYGQGADKIFVPGFWESCGYNDFDGTANYSIEFVFPSNQAQSELYLILGYIDDIDKVYLNDTKIGAVDMIKDKNKDLYPHQIFRQYLIPEGVLNVGSTNTLRVKVYDTGGLGGIYAGPIGIATAANASRLKKQQVPPPVNIWDQFFRSIFD